MVRTPSTPQPLEAQFTHASLEKLLTPIVGDRLSLNPNVLRQHGKDEGYHACKAPIATVFPESTEEVSRLVRACGSQHLAIVAWGAGTSLEGHVIPVGPAVTVDFSRMTQVIAVHADDLTVTVQAGVRRRQLNALLRDTGLFFPIDPGADATIGGMASTRASGTTAVRYGTMRDNVLSCTAVMADGQVITTASRAPKSAAGYDLTALLVGSEGTLGLITELTLRLHGVPESVGVSVLNFDDDRRAIDAVIAAMQLGLGVARIEYLDAQMMDSINRFHQATFPLGPTLIVEFHGSAALVTEQLAMLKEIAEAHGGRETGCGKDEQERKTLWQARHDALYAAKALRPGAVVLITDVCVPISRLGDCLAETRRDLNSSALPSPIVGHVGDGNFHAFLVLDPDNSAEIAEAEALHTRMARRAIALGGTCTGEHGIGLGKIHLLEEELGPSVGVMRTIKRALDPHALLNPGKLFY